MKAIVHIKMDKELKKQAAETAERMGLPLSGVINALLRNFVQTQQLNVTSAPRLTPYAEKLVVEAEKDFRSGKNIDGPFEDMDKAIEFLKKQVKKN